MKNVHTLFDLGKLEKRKTSTEKKFQEENLDLLNEFSAAVDYAFKMLHKEIFRIFKANAMDRNLPAVSINSFIRQYIIEKLPVYCRHATEGRFKLVTDNGQYIYLKKLDDNKMPMNISTDANDMIMNQYTSCGADKGANVFLGYTTDDGFSKITGKYAVCIDGNKKVWAFDLSTLESNEATIITLPNKPNKPKLKEGVIKIKRGKQKNE